MTITRGSNPKQLQPGLHALAGLDYKKTKPTKKAATKRKSRKKSKKR